MASPTSLIEGMYRTVQDRKAELGRLSLVEFDDEEYKILLPLGRKIAREYQGWSARDQQKARTVFLALACEYVRRNKYIDDNKFWLDFEEELSLGRQHYALISEELLWQTYEEESIEQKWSSGNIRRLFVESLISEVNASETTRQEILDFFLWYYRNYSVGEVTAKLIHSYGVERGKQLSLGVERGKQLSLPKKALAALNKDCQVLAR